MVRVQFLHTNVQKSEEAYEERVKKLGYFEMFKVCLSFIHKLFMIHPLTMFSCGGKLALALKGKEC